MGRMLDRSSDVRLIYRKPFTSPVFTAEEGVNAEGSAFPDGNSIASRDIHGSLRQTERDVNPNEVWDNLTGRARDSLVFTAPEGGPLNEANFRMRIWNPGSRRPESGRCRHRLRQAATPYPLAAGRHRRAARHRRRHQRRRHGGGATAAGTGVHRLLEPAARQLPARHHRRTAPLIPDEPATPNTSARPGYEACHSVALKCSPSGAPRDGSHKI